MENGTGTVLVVDDDVLQCELVRCRVQLHLEPLDVVAFHDGVEALEYLTKAVTSDPSTIPTAVFLDHDMPRMNGVEFLSELRADPRLAVTPVVFVSADEDPEVLLQIRSLGVERQFTKSEFNADPSIVSRVLRELQWRH